MTEFSMLPWETQTGTGDGITAYTQVQANNFFRYFDIRYTDAEGVVMGTLNQLVITGSASPLAVDTGAAYSYGRYHSDASVNLVVATPAADTGGRVVLRTDWATNTIRLAVLANSSGVTAAPAITQTFGTLWEISLATYVVDNAGAIWTDSGKGTAGVTDTRVFLKNPGAMPIDVRWGNSGIPLPWSVAWTTFGGGNVIPFYPQDTFIAIGTLTENYGGATSLTGSIVFPDSFAFDQAPIILTGFYTSPFGEYHHLDTNPSTTGINFHIETADGTTSFDTFVINFMVIGPVRP
jgi:hypothetical protein